VRKEAWLKNPKWLVESDLRLIVDTEALRLGD